MWLFILILRDERPGAGWRNGFSNNRKRITEDQGDPPSWNKTPDFAFQEAKEPKEVKMSQRQEENTGNRLLEKFIPMCAGYLEHHSVQLWKTENFLALSVTEELAASREHCHISIKTQKLTRTSSTHRCLQGWSLKAPLWGTKQTEKDALWYSMCVHVCSNAKTCPILCDPMDCGPPGSSHRISQARILDWVAISSSRGSSRPGVAPVSPALTAAFFTTEPPGKTWACHILSA